MTDDARCRPDREYDEIEDRWRDNDARWYSNHTDGYDADDYSRPVNGLGTYYETDAAW